MEANQGWTYTEPNPYDPIGNLRLGDAPILSMVRPGRDRHSGRVEVDETYLGGLEEGVHGRRTEGKALIAVVAQEDGLGIGRIPAEGRRWGRRDAALEWCDGGTG